MSYSDLERVLTGELQNSPSEGVAVGMWFKVLALVGGSG